MTSNIYNDKSYEASNPDWHMADSAWKAKKISVLLQKNGISFQSCVEVGCGGGRVLSELASLIPGPAYSGYDISPDAAKLWPKSPAPSVSYHLSDFLGSAKQADLILLVDVFEHIEDYFGFLRKLSVRAKKFVFHIPLDMHISGLLRDTQIHAREKVGHINYFSRATALATLKDTGYQIIDESFTKLSQETVEGHRPLTSLTNIARSAMELASIKFAAKLLGGYSLLVLCEPKDI